MSFIFQSVSHPQTTPESSLVPSRPATPLHRTAWRGISSLPPEILQEIYLNHPGYQHEMEWPLTASRHPCIEGQECQSLCWLAVSRVCRQWRDTALCCQLLWTVLPVSAYPEWMTILLRRSGSSPLVVNASSLGVETSDAVRRGREESLAIALREIHRIRSLYIYSNQGLPREILSLLERPSPLLDTIFLRGVLVDKAELSLDLDPDVILPDMTCDGNIPLPRCLSLYHASLGVVPTGPCISMLRRLAIALPPNPRWPWPSLSQVLNTFSMFPALQDLSFIRQGDEIAFDDELNDTRRVTLQHVHTLDIAGWAHECALILESLELPSLSFLEVSARECTSSDIQELAPILRAKISSLDTTRRLGIAGFRNCDDPGPLWFYGYASYGDEAYRSSAIGYDPLFLIRLLNCEDLSECVSVMCGEALPCADVHFAMVECELVAKLEWRAMLQALKNLRVLVVRWDEKPWHFFPEICRVEDSTQDPAAHGHAGLVCPKLEELYLHEVHLDAQVVGKWDPARPSSRSGKPEPLIDGLKWALRQRAKAGRSLELWLNLCPGVHEEMIGDLADTVGYGGGVRALRVRALPGPVDEMSSSFSFTYGVIR